MAQLQPVSAETLRNILRSASCVERQVVLRSSALSHRVLFVNKGRNVSTRPRVFFPRFQQRYHHHHPRHTAPTNSSSIIPLTVCLASRYLYVSIALHLELQSCSSRLAILIMSFSFISAEALSPWPIRPQRLTSSDASSTSEEPSTHGDRMGPPRTAKCRRRLKLTMPDAMLLPQKSKSPSPCRQQDRACINRLHAGVFLMLLRDR